MDFYTYTFRGYGQLYPGQPGDLRGGSWNNNRDNARAAYRNNNHPDNRNNNVGLRVVVVRRPTPHTISLEGHPPSPGSRTLLP
ncbi:MAG: hypothetical protein KC418_02850 [Anaerolineales bacterium]|nr:hypothetical protein [Anaerolineales bacterium]